MQEIDMDPFLKHEALHMASVLTSMVEEHLATHPAIEANQDWKAKADEAVLALAKLYQAIGGERHCTLCGTAEGSRHPYRHQPRYE